MIRVFIPSDEGFEKYKDECKKLYKMYQDKICDPNSFEFIVQNTFFYLFTNDDCLIGAIYYFIADDGKLYVNAFAKRKMHEICLKCFKMSLGWFRGSIYAEVQNRASALCLLKCGFKRVNDNLFCYESA